jgi:hypothetical protein
MVTEEDQLLSIEQVWIVILLQSCRDVKKDQQQKEMRGRDQEEGDKCS